MNKKKNPLVIHAEADGETVAVGIYGNGDGNDVLNAYTAITESVMVCCETHDSNSLTEEQLRMMIEYCVKTVFNKRDKEIVGGTQ